MALYQRAFLSVGLVQLLRRTICSKWDSTKGALLCGTSHVERARHYEETSQGKGHKNDGAVQRGSFRGASICLAWKTAYRKCCTQTVFHQSVPFHAEEALAYGQMPWSTSYNDVHVYRYATACESANKNGRKMI
jgi:hypothetical protein